MRCLALFVFLVGCGAKADHEKEFETRMKGVTLVGSSTRTNKDGVFGPERYRIDSVTKAAGDTWIFQTRMNYSGKEIAVPIPVPVRWVGKTPVIAMEDLTIPGVGTWTAHIVLSGDQYAGTWKGEKGGGQMFGRIVKE
ncbi:MAG: hypothetical protein FJW30_26735 [Acidobacteria bacterium]|nr:hypothetical protein [Acidobacteriota bacterium]